MIDWDAPDAEPDAVPPHPLLARPIVTLRTMDDCLKLIDEYEAAYQEACTAWARLHTEYIHMKERAENAAALAANYEFLYERTGGARELDDHNP